MDRLWLRHYPPGVPSEIDAVRYPSLVAMFEESFTKYAGREACACMGTGDERLRTYGRLLGMLYHGCDDVGDVRGAVSLGGGGDEDLRDGIVTLPVAIAIRDPAVAVLFRDPSPDDLETLVAKVGDALPAAEQYLDRLADEAIAEARRVARNSGPLIDLVRNTRLLSK